MGILYNANLTPAMNDTSVTSGNADGWVYAVASSMDAVVVRPADSTSRPASKNRTANGERRTASDKKANRGHR